MSENEPGRRAPSHKKICEYYLEEKEGSTPDYFSDNELKVDFAYKENDSIVVMEVELETPGRDIPFSLHLMGHLANSIIQNVEGKNISKFIWLCRETHFEKLRRDLNSIHMRLRNALGENQNLLPELKFDTVDEEIIKRASYGTSLK
jgi:hypothetical protein